MIEKNIQLKCQTCEDKQAVHYQTGWKHTGWPCPDCKKDDFIESVIEMQMKAEVVIGLIRAYGKPGEE